MKKLFSLIMSLVLITMLSGCSTLTDPVTDEVAAVKDLITKNDESIMKSLEALKTEPETVEVEVTTTLQSFNVCVIGSVNGVKLLNAEVTQKQFSDIVTIEYDGSFGRDTSQYDSTKVYISCTKAYGSQ